MGTGEIGSSGRSERDQNVRFLLGSHPGIPVVPRPLSDMAQHGPFLWTPEILSLVHTTG